MATPKKVERDSIFDLWRQQQEALDKESPVLKNRWVVEEYVPSHDDNEGRWVGEVSLHAWYFYTEDEANNFIDTHDPDKKYWYEPARFRIVKQNQREFHEKRWVSY